ncbi:MAG: alpha/beta hydrolase [Thermoleophilia bacterium]
MAVLNHYEWGPEDGPAVLFVHGVQNTGARYRRLAEEGFPECRAIAVDLRGHAASLWDPPWGADTHVADLVDTMDALGLERAPVVGHSFGGMLTTHLVAAAPERVERAALLDPAVAIAPSVAAQNAENTRRDDGWETAEEAHAARAAMRPPHAVGTVEEDLRIFMRLDEDGRYRFAFSRPAAITAWGEMARPPAGVDGFGGELLLVTALQADLVNDRLRNRLRADLGDRFREVGIDAGHMLFWDAFEELVAVLRPFLGLPPLPV